MFCMFLSNKLPMVFIFLGRWGRRFIKKKDSSKHLQVKYNQGQKNTNILIRKKCVNIKICGEAM